jgi:transposase
MKLDGLTARERRDRERARLVAAELFEQKVPQAEIARLLEVSPQAVSKWHRQWREGGTEALLSAGPSGARPYLDDEQVRAVLRALEQGPVAHGWEDQRWTLARIGRVITEVTGVSYRAPDGVWRLLRRLGWSWQAPAKRAIERDEKAIIAWRTKVWPRVKGPRPRPGRGSASPTRPEPR